MQQIGERFFVQNSQINTQAAGNTATEHELRAVQSTVIHFKKFATSNLNKNHLKKIQLYLKKLAITRIGNVNTAYEAY